jgi:hypothetical protein
MAKSDQMPDPVRVIAEKLSQSRPMRRGSLGERFIKCGKARCACATDEQARHGPYFSLTRTVGGRTQSRRLSAQDAERVRQQLVTGREFRQQVEALWEVCEQWADDELALQAAEQAEKKGSSRSSPRKSRPRSKRS